MPVPIKTITDNPSEQQNNTHMDYSFLFNQQPDNSKKKVTASNRDAKMLYDIWSNCKKCGANDIFQIDVNKFSQRDIMRLKVMGFITKKDDDKVAFTSMGKRVVTTMSLGEQNAFLKTRKNKKYTEILASMDKKGKKGFRSASDVSVFSTNNNNKINLKNI